MDVFEGTIRNGQIVLDIPAVLPDGTRVEITPMSQASPTLGMREQDWPTTPEGIAALVARMEQIEPGWLSPEDEAAWRAALRTQKECEKAQSLEEADRLQRLWP